MRARRPFELIVMAVLFVSFDRHVEAQSCPEVPTASVSSAQPPLDVCLPDDSGTNFPIDYFDDYSWRAFIALVWPAANGQRGLPDTTKTVNGPGPRVFETYKSLWEIFHTDNTAPSSSSFNNYESAQFNACQQNVNFGDLVLASFSKFSDIGQAGAGSLVGPLPGQNGLYTRYLTLYNQIEFDKIFQEQWFFRRKLPVVPTPAPPVPVVQFPAGSIDVKAAWIDLTGMSDAQRQRYYTRQAWVLNPNDGTCSEKEVGLVGLHIVQKTPSRPQWIWSTFEQVDNVPPAEPGSTGKFAFNDGTSTAMPGKNPLTLSPLAPQPVKPFNVTRSASTPIHPKTTTTNSKYRNLLAGTVWANYQLVMTQWPTGQGNQPVPTSQGGDVGHTCPGVGAVGQTCPSGAASAFANVTMETFDQTRVQFGCMSCHAQARNQGDFVWSMLDHAFPPSAATPDLFFRDTSFKDFQKFMLQAAPPKQTAPPVSNHSAPSARKKSTDTSVPK